MALIETTLPDPVVEEIRAGLAERGPVVDALVVDNRLRVQTAEEWRKQAEERLDLIEQKVGGPVKQAYDAWRSLKDLQNELEAPWKRIKEILGQKIIRYQRQLEEDRRKELERLAAIAREAEAKRQEELRAAEREAEARRAKLAEAARSLGDEETARTIEGRPLEVAPPPPPPPLPPAPTVALAGSGSLTFPKTWRARLVDLDALIVAAAGRPELRGLLAFNEQAANALARSAKRHANAPGVEFFEDTGIRNKAKR